jgi:Tol biopolymer transport system component
MPSPSAVRRAHAFSALTLLCAVVAAGCTSDSTAPPDPVVSPLAVTDLIVYTAFDITTGRGATYRVTSDGAARLPLSTASDEVGPELSPDGTRIVTVRLVDTLPQVFVMNTDGSGDRLAAAVVGGAYWPSWTPDGHSIMFTNYDELKTWMMSADGSGPHRVVAGSEDEQTPALSPDGKRIVFTSARMFSNTFAVFELYIMDVDGGNLQRLTTSPEMTWGYNVYPRWSPDGTRIAFIRSINDGVAHVFLMNADGSDMHQVTSGDLNDLGVSWSPDGRHLAISREVMGGLGDIYVADVNDGAHLVNITNSPNLDERYPSWGRRVAR